MLDEKFWEESESHINMEEFLKATKYCDCQHPEILRMAKKITAHQSTNIDKNVNKYFVSVAKMLF